MSAGLGNHEGAVITRNRNGTDESGHRGVWKMGTPPASWYRLETNFDNWKPLTDGRRQAASISDRTPYTTKKCAQVRFYV